MVHHGITCLEAEEHLKELAMLADTAGAQVAQTIIQKRHKIDPATMIGIGKVRQVVQACEFHEATVVVFDDELSPAQVKNLEAEFKIKVLDRSGLILDIFARRARTREAQTQVELAQLEYLYPRLTRQWTHLSRQVGGIGTRGPGETQLEVDRRLIRKRIKVLKENLRKIEKQRSVRREGRRNFRQVALIGYTNAGKSSLMNALTQSDVFVEDRLFATLDATVRSLPLRTFPKVLITDTVGFIRKLPHDLVASFRSTLEETFQADLLVHMIDISYPNFNDHIEITLDLLKEMGMDKKPRLLVFNKIDRLINRDLMHEIKIQHPEAVFVSALTGLGLTGLVDRMDQYLRSSTVEEVVRIPAGHGRSLDFVHQWADVLYITYENSTAVVRYRTSCEGHSRILDFLEKQHEAAHSCR
ncbi:GTPase HflX [bacterium]|nr:GTPase HflX [bacterium]